MLRRWQNLIKDFPFRERQKEFGKSSLAKRNSFGDKGELPWKLRPEILS
jgi:hypothetical protein